MDNKKTIAQRIGDYWFGSRPPPPQAKQKAMADLHPELVQREHLLSARAGGYDQWVGATYPYMQAIGDYETNVWLRKAVKLISDAIAPLPIEVLVDSKPIASPVVDLFAHINDSQSSADFWREWTIDLMLGGESGIELVAAKNGAVVEMWGRWPNVFSVVPDPKNKRYRAVSGYIIDDGDGEPYTLKADEFIHFKFTNPRNRWRGVSPFIANRLGLKIDRYAREWAKDFFENSALPALAVITPTGTTTTERDAILAQILAMYRGGQNGVLMLEKDVMDVKPISHAPKDINFIEQREMSRDEVAAAAGIPDILMGFGNDSYDTPDKRTNAEATMWSLTIRPLIEYRDNVLTSHFRTIGSLTDAQSIKTNLSQVSALADDYGRSLSNAQALYNMNVPFNVIDEKLKLRIGPIPNGDIGNADRNPLGAFDAFGLSDEPQVNELRIVSPETQHKKRMVIPKGHAVEFGSELHRDLWELSEKRISRHVLTIADVVRTLFEEQRAAVIASLAAQKSVADIGDDPFDIEEWEREAVRRARPAYSAATRAAGAAALDDVGVSIDFDLFNPRVAAQLRRALQRFARRINATTWAALRETLAQGLEAGEGSDALARRVEQTMTLRINQSAEAIARTEAASASTVGTIEGWRQSGVVTRKTWLATFDSRTRDTHAAAHGQTVDLDDEFTVGSATGQGPGLMDEAGESINCRCTTMAEVER